MNQITPPPKIEIIPSSAPFSEAQRSWLNGFFAGLLSDAPTPLSAEQGAAVMQGVDTNYHIDILRPLVEAAGDVCGVKYNEADDNGRRLRRIADHDYALPFLFLHQRENLGCLFVGVPGSNFEAKRPPRHAVCDEEIGAPRETSWRRGSPLFEPCEHDDRRIAFVVERLRAHRPLAVVSAEDDYGVGLLRRSTWHFQPIACPRSRIREQKRSDQRDARERHDDPQQRVLDFVQV